MSKASDCVKSLKNS